MRNVVFCALLAAGCTKVEAPVNEGDVRMGSAVEDVGRECFDGVQGVVRGLVNGYGVEIVDREGVCQVVGGEGDLVVDFSGDRDVVVCGEGAIVLDRYGNCLVSGESFGEEASASCADAIRETRDEVLQFCENKEVFGALARMAEGVRFVFEKEVQLERDGEGRLVGLSGGGWEVGLSYDGGGVSGVSLGGEVFVRRPSEELPKWVVLIEGVEFLFDPWVEEDGIPVQVLNGIFGYVEERLVMARFSPTEVVVQK